MCYKSSVVVDSRLHCFGNASARRTLSKLVTRLPAQYRYEVSGWDITAQSGVRACQVPRRVERFLRRPKLGPRLKLLGMSMFISRTGPHCWVPAAAQVLA